MKAQVLCDNDAILAVVLDNMDKAKEEIERLRHEEFIKLKNYFGLIEAQIQIERHYFHIHEVEVL